MEIKPWPTPPKTLGGRKKIVEVTAIPTAIWLAPNTHLKHAGNPAPTTTDKQHDKPHGRKYGGKTQYNYLTNRGDM